jgi:hypothetical protein
MKKDYTEVANALMKDVLGNDDEALKQELVLDKAVVPTQLKEKDVSSVEKEMAKAKDKQRTGKGIEKAPSVKHKITENVKPEKQKIVPLPRYEIRPDIALDDRFRKYRFETRNKTNETLVAALDFFLSRKEY